MENFRHLKNVFYITLGGTLFVLPFFSFAYDDKTTHPALTQEIVKLFNRHSPSLVLNDSEMEHIIQGSIDEDLGIRWMHHFYDPVYNRGFTYGAEWMSSKEWVQDTKKQAGFTDSAFAGTFKSLFSGENDYSWDRAIYEYAWGDKERGLQALGHVLHLIEDTGVPDHTRNDPHPPIHDFGSPYETWAKKFSRKNIGNDSDFSAIQNYENLNYYFEELATYSNKNFFSKDTIFDFDYTYPVVKSWKKEKLGDGLVYNFGYSDQDIRIVADRTSNWRTIIEERYIINDPDELIFNDYWHNLSEQTILHGAGVVKLFFDEVEKESRTKELYNKNKSWIGKQIDKFKKGMFGVASVLYGSSVELGDVETSDANEILPNPPLQKEGDDDYEASDNPDSSPAGTLSVPADRNDDVENSPPAGGETSDAQRDSSLTAQNDKKKILPDPPLRKEGDNAVEASPPAGGKTPRQKKPQSRSTSDLLPIAGVGGPPAPELMPPPPPTPPPPPPPAPPADTEAPSISLAISECNQSLSPDSCLIATTTITLEWSSVAPDFSYYTITCSANGSSCSGFSIATTTATTTKYTAPSDTTTYIFTAKATDTTGNTSAPEIKSAEVVTRPIVINEIAWAGTSASRSADEWIELFNTTSKTLDISQIKLTSLTDNKPNINLSGTIPLLGYYIIERTNNDTISDLTASTTASFGDGSSGTGLLNSGETIAITYKGAIIDQTPAISDCGGWCGGAASGSYPTMERYDPYASGTDKENWGNGGDFLTNGKNADNVDIKGTPGKRNTINYLITKNGTTLSSNATITKSRSPYVIPSSGFTIQSGAKLTIQPGVVIKFYSSNSPSLTVSGKIIAEGTENENIVFTSLKDDSSYDGDTNNDGSATSPAAEDWGSIKILADESVMKYIKVRYAGKRDVPGAGMFANIRVENASTSITYSTIEHSGVYGLWLKTASGTIAHNTIQNNTRNIGGQEKGTGIVISGGAPDIKENTITKNIVGFSIDTEGSPAITKNSFTQHTEDAIIIVSSYPSFSQNTASGNGTNGIALSGIADKDFTLFASLPFVIKLGSDYTVSAGKIVTIAPGTIFKMRGRFLVSGKLTAEGTATQNIVFTSLNDDTYGGDTNGTTTIPAAADWKHIAFNAGSASSSLKYFRARYGGDDGINAARGAIRITDVSIDMNNVTVEKNYYAGIYMTNSASTSIAHSLIQDHTDLTSTIYYGIFLTSSSTPAISNTAFKNNETHIFSDGTSSSPESYIGSGNTFE